MTPGPDANAVPDDAGPFWEGLAAERLVLPRCEACESLIWYPRAFCPTCWGRDLIWVTMSGRASIYSHTQIVRGGLRPDGAAYVVACVELEEGPRLLANVEGDGAGSIQIGTAVVAAVGLGAEAEPLLRFVIPAADDSIGTP